MLLVDPGAYAPGTLDLAGDPELRRYWLDLFRRHTGDLVAHVASEHPGEPAIVEATRRAAVAFLAHLDSVEHDPRARFDTLTLCAERERCLRAARVDDPFARIKARENAAALELLPGVVAAIDSLDPRDRTGTLVRGIFAGNIFDLGSPATAALFAAGKTSFHDVRERLAPRPWRVDDFDVLCERIERGVLRALVFVDNAGSDVVLGIVPFVRELLRAGGDVVLAANATPALNDITHGELGPLLDRAADQDELLAKSLSTRRLRLVSSGGGLPLLDLRKLSVELRREIAERPPDLVVLEGMGRAIESNWDARLRFDTLKIAMLKDASVARRLGGSLWDLVCRFEPGPSPRS